MFGKSNNPVDRSDSLLTHGRSPVQSTFTARHAGGYNNIPPYAGQRPIFEQIQRQISTPNSVFIKFCRIRGYYREHARRKKK